MPFTPSTRACAQTQEPTIKQELLVLTLISFGSFNYLSGKKEGPPVLDLRGTPKITSPKGKIVTSKIKTTYQEPFKKLDFQNLWPQISDIYNTPLKKKKKTTTTEGFKNICSSQAKQLFKF